jgi:UDP-glucose 4-epimerase
MSLGPVLILGGGFIGRALAQRLAMEGCAVTIVSRAAPAAPVPGVVWRQGRLDDATLLHELLPGCQSVVHAATTSTPGSYRQEPSRDAQENLLPLLRLLEAMDEFKDVHLLYLSSGGAIYGNPDKLPVDESLQPQPLSYHAAGKAAAEQFLGVFARQGHPVTILRPSNAYGPGQPIKAGFGVILTLLAHLRDGTPMEVWGDGESVRDYLYIDDLVAACMAILASPRGGIFNVGSGVGVSLNELCPLAERVTGRALRVHRRPARSVDVRAVILDSAALRASHGWQPMVTLEQGLLSTWQWLNGQA